MFAKRTDWPLAPNQISLKLETLRQSGIKILDLTESNPTQCQFEYPANPILAPLSDPQNLTHQPSSKGTESARRAILEYYREKGIRLNLEQIFLTASTSEAYSFIFRLLVNPDETVLAPKPSYPLFDYLTQLNDIHLEYYSLLYAEKWTIHFDSLEKWMDQKPKAMILVNPNNPTGSFIKESEFKKINEFALTHEFALISDEVFLDYPLDTNSSYCLSAAANKKVLTFTLGGISKTLALPQMKLAWMVVSGPQTLLKDSIERLEIICDTYLSVNSPAQHSLSNWLSLRRGIQKQITDRIQANQDFLKRQIAASLLKLLNAEGGWCAILKLGQRIDEERLVLKLLETKHVLVHPGYFFDLENHSHLVLSLLLPPSIFKEGVHRILDGLEQVLKEL